ncbi:MAG: signal peptidase I [Candidatus Magasanikbacteria bacterium]
MTDKISFSKRLLKWLASAGLVFLEFVKVAVLAGITIGLVRYFLFKPFVVKGASMEPNFFEKEYLIIDELSFRLREPKRGEVIVFKYPENPKEYFIKRIIGLPGERVKVAEGNVIIYNDAHPEGLVVEENYISDDVPTTGERITELGSHEYFVLGDNRSNSLDSRRFGAVDNSLIVGRVWLRGWPVSRIQKFDIPSY